MKKKKHIRHIPTYLPTDPSWPIHETLPSTDHPPIHLRDVGEILPGTGAGPERRY